MHQCIFQKMSCHILSSTHFLGVRKVFYDSLALLTDTHFFLALIYFRFERPASEAHQILMFTVWEVFPLAVTFGHAHAGSQWDPTFQV